MASKYVYFFGGGRAEGRAGMKALLGGKGANLAEMTNIGVPVPPGFTITTEACKQYYEQGQRWPAGLDEEVRSHLDALESLMQQRLGAGEPPLLVSVRSGAAVSMPGMMDTVLNLGLTSDSVEQFARATRNPRLAWDSYRRLIEMFANVAMGVPRNKFEHELVAVKKAKGVEGDLELTAEDMQAIATKYKEVYKRELGEAFPDDPMHQLKLAVTAVFRSWNNPRAHEYRMRHRIVGLHGTAVNVQAMVFGNMGDTSGTGVAFTRNPATGEHKYMGDFLINAQGEDVVAGIRTPVDIDEMNRLMPPVYQQLSRTMDSLERHFRDVQDIEFTVMDNTLYLLQTRNAKRTAFAAVKCAVDMVAEGLIDPRTAVKRIPASDLDQLFAPVFDTNALKAARDDSRMLGVGVNASPGAAAGRIALTADRAVAMATSGPVLLVRAETSPEDIAGMYKSKGILTSRGGKTSHAAVVARGDGIPCVVGCGALNIDEDTHVVTIKGRTFKEGDWMSIDGSTGEVFEGEIPTKPSEIAQVLITKELKAENSPVYQNFAQILEWADLYRDLRVRTNSDTPSNARDAIALGAEGIGLCRTEHMFFGEDRILAVREMILAETDQERAGAIAKVKPFQKADFAGIFEVMDGLPCTIRLLDPPLHEFLPHEPAAIAEIAKETGKTVEQVKARVANLQETTPMLGHRGCRLGVTFPLIYDMQVEAIIEAACDVAAKGIKVHPEIMIPLVAVDHELRTIGKRSREIADRIIKDRGSEIEYQVGTMIEIPRAALTADEVAEHADFFSFGTNDLTQCAFGLSRDDSGKFLPDYISQGLLPVSPFETIDKGGVGRLIEIGSKLGRATKPNLKIGICGEHGGDPDSIQLCHKVGMNYVSCSPRRLPVARVAAAQAALADADDRERQRVTQTKRQIDF